MAMIPTQSKYPDRAGYMQFDTDRNAVEVFSDGKFGTVGAIPFDHNINIYVGPGGDFADPYEALDYIQHLQPAYGLYPYQHKINLIFKNTYIFNKPLIIDSLYAPWLHIMQEDLTTPLEATLEQPPNISNIILIKKSSIGLLYLNINYTGQSPENITGLQIQYSNVDISKIYISNTNIGLELNYQASIKNLYEFISSEIITYPIYVTYGSYLMIGNYPYNPPISIINSNRSTSSAIRNHYATILVYRCDMTIDNFTNGLAVIGGSIRFGGNAQVNIDNVDNGIYITRGGQVQSMTNAITYGPNVTNQIYPTDIIPNNFNYNGMVFQYTI